MSGARHRSPGGGSHGARPRRPDRPDPPDRRVRRSARGRFTGPERSEQPERPGRPEGPGRPGRVGRSARPGRVGPDGRRRGWRARGIGLGAVSSAALLVLGGLTVTGIGFAAASVWHGGSPEECADGTTRTTLTITTAPTLAAPISRLAAEFSRAHSDQDGPCVTFDVSATPSDRALDALSRATTPGSTVPDVWIPESADWLELGQESNTAAQQLPARATTIAGSPVVIAMPRLMAQRLGWPEHHLTWADLAADADRTAFWPDRGEPRWGEFRLAMANPENSAAALRAVIGTVGAARRLAPADMTPGTFDQDRAAQATVLHLERSIDWLPQYDHQLFDSVRDGGTENGAAGSAPSAFPALESDVIAYNRTLTARTGPLSATTLVASYPADGAFTATVPYIVLKRTTDSAPRHAAADAFAAYLRGDAGRRALTAAGFRTPAELAGRDDPGGLAATLNATDGVRSTPPKLASTDASDSVLGTARRFFRHSRERGATLAVLDTSGSMALPLTSDAGRTRLQAATDAAMTGLRLFAPDSQVGLWQSSAELPDGHRELAPLARLNAAGHAGAGHAGTQRDDLTASLAALKPGGSTDLYSTAVAAVRELTDRYAADRLNRVVLFTDGDADTGGDDHPDGEQPGRRATASAEPTLDQAVSALRAAADPHRPVQLIVIGCDPGADLASLQRLAGATGGHAYLAPDANALFDIYVDTLTGA
ncbi:substrate-binding and VWA domain-containing protein [Frankia sp. AvcI1]|uniref:substrate-binding and vWA domain-containing protein n=1 Tax=Frankia sp. AvcI1 TaxID=573496 RepID=UPI0006EBE897|nr:substrate-binding and VWA domain-containing protein [Frankia sp. AvcI1]